MLPVALLLAVSLTQTADLPVGQVIASVRTTANPSQSYALYLPKNYSTTRAWPLILAFDPGGRGQTAVERYQAAAEQYGFVVAGSNNSRNYSRDNDVAVTSMASDVLTRFRIDERRVYTAGMSGGARVAMGTALASTGIAGVMASSAGFPDGMPRTTVPFVVFATAGTEDFNHLELRRLDAKLTSPHRLVIFEGGHVWLSSELAIEAVEWMEVQAMKDGRRARDAAELNAIFARRQAALQGITNRKDELLALRSIVADFTGLANVSAAEARVSILERDPAVVTALREDALSDNHETDVLLRIKGLEARLADGGERAQALVELGSQWKALSEAANAAEPSSARQLARRVLGLLGNTASTRDAEYLQIMSEYRYGRGGGPGGAR